MQLLFPFVRNDGVHDPIRNPRFGRQRTHPHPIFQVGPHRFGIPVVYHPPLAQEKQVIQRVENIGSRLVDDQRDGVAQRRQVFECLYQRVGGGGIQPRGWFVAHQQGRADHDFLGQRDPFSLAPADGADRIVLYVQQVQFLGGFLHQPLHFLDGAASGHLEPCRKINGFLHRQVAQQEIVLPDHSDHLFGNPSYFVVDPDGSVVFVAGAIFVIVVDIDIHQVSNHGCEAGFSGSGWAHPGRQFKGFDLGADSVQD
mmetsp:Transcript_24273/g.51252  ORF Transcript_24273/g.51252 Transcript_24273/m.51252 type:complete len:255 (-) Transcript_24273:416-1180(-)